MPEQVSMFDSDSTRFRVLTFDLETLRSAGEVGGWDSIHHMGMACGVIHDTSDGEFHAYDEKEVGGLIEHLKKADLVVGFNHLRFDYRVLTGYSDFDFRTLPNFDILLDVTDRLGHRLKLDSLVGPTLKEKKSADGLQSLVWVKEGRFDLVREYCKKDVDVTRRLFEHGVKEGRVFYADRSGEPIVLNVDWDLVELVRKGRR